MLAAFAAAYVNLECIENIYYNINMLNKSHLKTAFRDKPWPRNRSPAGDAPAPGHDLRPPRRITVIFGGCERTQKPQSVALPDLSCTCREIQPFMAVGLNFCGRGLVGAAHVRSDGKPAEIEGL